MDKQDAQKVLGQIREALSRHRVVGVDVEGISEEDRRQFATSTSGMQWDDGSFFHFHQCCDNQMHAMRVMLETGEVYMGGQRIDNIDDWETSAALLTALFFDPRFLLAHLQDTEIASFAPLEDAGEVDNKHVLAGRVSLREAGIGGKDYRRLEQASPEELTQEIISTLNSYAIQVDVVPEEFLDEAVSATMEALSSLVRDAEKLDVEEIRQRFMAIVAPVYTVSLTLDERMLPVTVFWERDVLPQMMAAPSRTHFRYE